MCQHQVLAQIQSLAGHSVATILVGVEHALYVTLTHAAAKVDEAVVRYDINHKVTTLNVEGNEQSGYVYTVDWKDSHFFRTLECATLTYSKDKTDAVITLAKRIDNESH